MTMLHLVKIFILLLSIFHVHSTKVCWSDDKSCYTFGIRTGYDFVGNKKDMEQISECESVLIWTLMRKAVSWPSDNSLFRLRSLHRLKLSIIDNLREGRGELCEADIELLRKSEFPTQDGKAGGVTDRGRSDIQQIVDELKSKFPKSFVKPYCDEEYQIRYSASNGVSETADIFTKTMFGADFNFDKIRKPAEIDTTLNGPLFCVNWRETNFHGKYWGIVGLFSIIKYWGLRKDVSRRLGFQRTLGFDEIVLMYVGCGLESAMHPLHTASWCVIFTPEHLKQLQHIEDSFYYKSCGPVENHRYPHLNKVMTCGLYGDLIAQLSRGVHNRKFQNTFYFSDEKTLLLLLNGLGFLEDTSLNDSSSKEERTFRTSTLTPFASNLVAALYKCGENSFRVGFYLNGRIIRRPGQLEEMETWDDFKNRMHSEYLQTMLCAGDGNFCGQITLDEAGEDTTFRVFYEA